MSSTLTSVADLISKVSPDRLRATVEKLASYHTRNTLSPLHREAAEWLASEYRAIPGLQVEIQEYTLPIGKRVSEPTEAVQVVATLPGETDEIVAVSGHFDTLNLTQDQATGRAPGANDDGSGVSVPLELARILSEHKWRHTLKFISFSGEEQGLEGARAMAKRAKEEGWKIIALLNNDMIGNTTNNRGLSEFHQVRLFSAASHEHESRELARLAEWLVKQNMSDFGIKLVLRNDRYWRGGDHSPFNQQGFTAVRFVEAIEEYARQHTVDDLPEHMDFEYAARTARANLLTMVSLANAAPAPTAVEIIMEKGHHAHLKWNTTEGVDYQVFWRDTTSAAWEGCIDAGSSNEIVIEDVDKDNSCFAVAATGGIPIPLDSEDNGWQQRMRSS